MATPSADIQARHFPVSAGVLFGLGLGGFFDGIVLHQLLQWHHMLSSWYPITSIENLKLNTLWDGIFHSATYIFIVIGLFFLSPPDYVLAVLTGSAAAMLFASGQRPIKIAFNLANFALIAVVSYSIVAALVPRDGIPGIREWLAASD